MIIETNETETTSLQAGLNVQSILEALIKGVPVSKVFDGIVEGLRVPPEGMAGRVKGASLADGFLVPLMGVVLDEFGRLVEKYRYAKNKELFIDEVVEISRTLVTMAASISFATTKPGAYDAVASDLNRQVRMIFKDLEEANSEETRKVFSDGVQALLKGLVAAIDKVEARKKAEEGDTIGKTEGSA